MIFLLRGAIGHLYFKTQTFKCANDICIIPGMRIQTLSWRIIIPLSVETSAREKKVRAHENRVENIIVM